MGDVLSLIPALILALGCALIAFMVYVYWESTSWRDRKRHTAFALGTCICWGVAFGEGMHLPLSGAEIVAIQILLWGLCVAGKPQLRREPEGREGSRQRTVARQNAEIRANDYIQCFMGTVIFWHVLVAVIAATKMSIVHLFGRSCLVNVSWPEDRSWMCVGEAPDTVYGQSGPIAPDCTNDIQVQDYVLLLDSACHATRENNHVAWADMGGELEAAIWINDTLERKVPDSILGASWLKLEPYTCGSYKVSVFRHPLYFFGGQVVGTADGLYFVGNSKYLPVLMKELMPEDAEPCPGYQQRRKK